MDYSIRLSHPDPLGSRPALEDWPLTLRGVPVFGWKTNINNRGAPQFNMNERPTNEEMELMAKITTMDERNYIPVYLERPRASKKRSGKAFFTAETLIACFAGVLAGCGVGFLLALQWMQ